MPGQCGTLLRVRFTEGLGFLETRDITYPLPEGLRLKADDWRMP
jgi:hypothetical protein